jgi:hypothetical protein
VSWGGFERGLRYYRQKWSPSTRFRDAGPYLFTVTLLMTFLAFVSLLNSRGLAQVCFLVAVAYVLDAVVAHTSFELVPGDPMSYSRSVSFTVWAFWNVALAFAVLYAVLRDSFDPQLQFPRVIYFSIATVTTLGDTTKPCRWPGYMLVAAQVVIGFCSQSWSSPP